MNNKGQTTVLFSLIISVLFLFILSVFEVQRIYLSKVKIRAVVHSTVSNIMADYNSQLFEQYHLLFLDPTYGTGSEAVLEEKLMDYLEISLNGEASSGGKLYQFTIEEIGLADSKKILEDNMQQLKAQIAEHEKMAGLILKVEELAEKMKDYGEGMEEAASETERNATELPDTEERQGEDSENSSINVTDPREQLQEALRLGILNFVLPEGKGVSTEEFELNNAPSALYQTEEQDKESLSFWEIAGLQSFLKSAKEEDYSGLGQQAAFVDYVCRYFSNGVSSLEDTTHTCEVEYILEGKSSDYDNLEKVVEEIAWMRMPVNYAYLMTDTEKKSEALTMAAAICTMTGTEPLIEIVKYLLLGCLAYGETLCEMNALLSGEKIAYVKTKENWTLDLKDIGVKKTAKRVSSGMDYEDYLMLLLAKKRGNKQEISYARMLDMIEMNLQKTDPDFCITNCVGKLTIQGKISLNPYFIQDRQSDHYDYYFEEILDYE